MTPHLHISTSSIWQWRLTRTSTRSTGTWWFFSISLSEIRSSTTSAFETAMQRHTFQQRHHATSAIIKKNVKSAQTPKSNDEKRKSAAKHARDKERFVPRCRICQTKGKGEYHWHEDCPRKTASTSAKKTSPSRKWRTMSRPSSTPLVLALFDSRHE